VLASQDHAVAVLNDLIKAALDSAGGYRDAAEHAGERYNYRSIFADRAARRDQLAMQLQQEVRSLGADPETAHGIMGKAHNTFLDLKSALVGGSDKAVIDEIERGEDHIKGKFEEAMRDDDLPEAVRSAVSLAYQAVKADHDDVSRMKGLLD
jgi:uncharacterized protein (TIGR02284 family)